jgi:hypothetical protein
MLQWLHLNIILMTNLEMKMVGNCTACFVAHIQIDFSVCPTNKKRREERRRCEDWGGEERRGEEKRREERRGEEKRREEKRRDTERFSAIMMTHLTCLWVA